MTSDDVTSDSAQRTTQYAARSWERPAIIGILLIAAAFRLLALNDVPPGLHHDEVIIGQIAQDILRGHVAIYFTPGYGHEPLYHYVAAGMFAAMGASAFVLRLTSAFVAMLGLAGAYRFTRRLFAPVVAVGALAWMSVSLWPIFFARVGLRGIVLPLMTTLTAYCLWRALRLSFSSQPPAVSGHPSSFIPHPSSFILPGALLGFTLYTYQASRVFPVIFLLFTFYVLLFHRDLFKRAWRGLIVFFLTAAIVAAPLVIYLTVVNPTAEERIADLSGPLTALAAGDPSEVAQSTLNTLGMFTVNGDNVPIYNVSGRPVFPEPIGAALFYIGLIICLARWRKPAYAFMLIWFFVSLIPAMVTPFSPNFVRTIAAWPIPFVFAGLAMSEVSRVVTSSRSRMVALSPGHLATAAFVLVLVANSVMTAGDYFETWPRGDYVRFWQQTTWTQAARYLDADLSTLPVAASGLSIHDLDLQTFDLLLRRSDFKVKWFDCRSAILYPAGSEARYLSPDFFPCDPDLWLRYLPDAELITQPRWPDSGNVIFTLHRSPVRSFPESLLSPPVFIGGERFDAAHPLTDLEPAALPIDFDGLQFIGHHMDRESWQPGETVIIDTYWKVTAPLAPPLKLFIHVTAPDGSMLAQFDGLDVNVALLEAGDVFIQRHRLALPADATGAYRVSLGAYHPDTGARLTATMGDRRIDTIVLDHLNLVK